MFGGFGADDRYVGRDDVVVLRYSGFGLGVHRVLFVAVPIIQLIYVLFELLDLGCVLFLLFSQLIYFTCKTHGLSIQLDHDGPPDVVVDFPQLISVDHLLD